jgi:hypothetical protein
MAEKASATRSIEEDRNALQKTVVVASATQQESAPSAKRFVTSLCLAPNLIYIHINKIRIGSRRNANVGGLRGPLIKKKNCRENCRENTQRQEAYKCKEKRAKEDKEKRLCRSLGSGDRR